MITLAFNTAKTFTDITESVQKAIPDGAHGIVHVFSKHTTAGRLGREIS